MLTAEGFRIARRGGARQPDYRPVPLEDGSRIAVIGAGPAGSMFA